MHTGLVLEDLGVRCHKRVVHQGHACGVEDEVSTPTVDKVTVQGVTKVAVENEAPVLQAGLEPRADGKIKGLGLTTGLSGSVRDVDFII